MQGASRRLELRGARRVVNHFSDAYIAPMSAAHRSVESLFRPLDAVRRAALKTLGPVARPFIRNRSLRVAAFGCTVVALSLLTTIAAPFWLLALGPILWGIPHLVSDLRYLVFRPGLHRQKRLWGPVGIPLVIAGTGFFPMYFGLLAALAAALLATGTAARKCLATLGLASLFAAVVAAGNLAQLVFAHLHNFIAVLLWWLWRPRVGWLTATVPLLFLGCSILLFTGLVAPPEISLGWAPAALPFEGHAAAMAPGLESPWALRLVLLFAFAQAVHYGVWLRLIPEDDRPQKSPRTFAASFRALRVDMGGTILTVAALFAAGVAVWAVVDLARARNGYLRLALFHGYLELAAAAMLFVSGGALRKQSSPTAAPISR